MADSTNDSKSERAPSAAARWRRWLLRLASVLGAVAVGAVVGMLVAPTPGTLLLQELRHDERYTSPVGVGAWRGQPVVVRLPDRALRRPLTVRRLVDAVALPVPVSAPTWEKPPEAYAPFLPLVIANDRLSVLDRPLGLFDADTNQRSPDGGRDCISDIPLDGGPAVRRCHSPSLRIWAMSPLHVVDRDVFYAGDAGSQEAVALASVGADGTWRQLDRVVHSLENVVDTTGNIVHDSDAIYWSNCSQVRRVNRKDGSVRTIFDYDTRRPQSVPLRIAMVGRTLVALVVTMDWSHQVYAIDPGSEARASTTKPFAVLNFGPEHFETDGEAMYLFDGHLLKRLTLDGKSQVLARFEDQAYVEDLTLVGDHIVYLATDIEGSPRSLKVWSVPK